MASYGAQITGDVRDALKNQRNKPGGFQMPPGTRYSVCDRIGGRETHVTVTLRGLVPAEAWEDGYGPHDDADDARRLTPEATKLVNRVRWVAMRAAAGRGTGTVAINCSTCGGEHEVGLYWTASHYKASQAAERQPDPEPATARRPELAGDSRECAKCGDPVLTLSSDDKCDGCVAEEDVPPAAPQSPRDIEATVLRLFADKLEAMVRVGGSDRLSEALAATANFAREMSARAASGGRTLLDELAEG